MAKYETHEGIMSLNSVQKQIDDIKKARKYAQKQSTTAGKAGLLYGALGGLALILAPLQTLSYGITTFAAGVGAGFASLYFGDIDSGLDSALETMEDLEDVFQKGFYVQAKVEFKSKKVKYDGEYILIPIDFRVTGLRSKGSHGWSTM